jgi:hypothetical protein
VRGALNFGSFNFFVQTFWVLVVSWLKLAALASLRSKVMNDIFCVTQARPSRNRANPGLSYETPVGVLRRERREMLIGGGADWVRARALPIPIAANTAAVVKLQYGLSN